MTDHELEQKIRTAFEHAAPDQLDSILSFCDDTQKAKSPFPAERERKKGDIIDMSEKNHKGIGRRGFMAAAAAAVLIVFAGIFGVLRSNMVRPVDSVVILDVNPSISLSVDAKERVLAAEALNEDAKDILGSMELKDTTLEVAVNAIIGSMLQKGYLGDMQNAILVSVENADAAKGEQLQKKVSRAIENAVHTDTLDAAVLSQVVNADDAQIAALAEQYGISMGKAALIQEVIKQVPALSFESLAPMSINEIALIASSRNVSSKTVKQSGAASDKAYIGQEEALKIACGHAGIAVSEAQHIEVEFDSEKGIMAYEVEFEDSLKEYEYDIDAVTGEILKFEIDSKKGAAASATGHHGGSADNYSADAGNQGGEIGHHGESADGFNTSAGNQGEEAGHHSESAGKDAQASGSAYIGEAAAWQIAFGHAGVAEDSAAKKEIELDSDDGRMIYEIEFEVGKTEYEYEIDAKNGDILKVDIDLDD